MEKQETEKRVNQQVDNPGVGQTLTINFREKKTIEEMERRINEQVDKMEIGELQTIEPSDENVFIEIAREGENSYSLYIECVSPIDNSIYEALKGAVARSDCFRAVSSYLQKPKA